MVINTKPGTFDRYLHQSGSFVTHMAHAIQCADPINLELIRDAFPQMVAAKEMRSWDEAPERFEPQYNAIQPKRKDPE